MYKVLPGATANVPDAEPPKPPATLKALRLPWAPKAWISTEVTPAGTVHVCTAPVKLKVCEKKLLFVVGVTVIVAVIGPGPGLVPMNEGILPVPLAPRPIDVLLFVQLNIVPGTVPLNMIGTDGAPLHTVWSGTGFTVGVGFTVMVNVVDAPVQVIPLV
jgi:hypothetical protein